MKGTEFSVCCLSATAHAHLAKHLLPATHFRKELCWYICAVFHTVLDLQATNGKDSSLGLGGKGSAGKVMHGARHSNNQ